MRLFILLLFFVSGGVLGAANAQEVSRADLLQWYHDAQSLIESGKLDDAIQVYEKIKKNAPELADSYVKLGELYLKKGDLNSAKQALINYQKYLSSGTQILNRSEIEAKVEQLTDFIIEGESGSLNASEQKPESKRMSEQNTKVNNVVMPGQKSSLTKTEPEDTVMIVKAASDEDYANSTLFDFEDDGKVDQRNQSNIFIKSQISSQDPSILIVSSEYAQEITSQLIEVSGKSFVYTPLTEQQKLSNAALMELYNKKLQSVSSNAFDMNDLAWLYINGIGTNKDFNKAFSNLTTATAKGNLFAYLNLGLIHEKGLGVDIDLEKAISYYQKAANQGYTDAYVMLGDLYKSQIGYLTGVEEQIITNYQLAYFKNNPSGIYKLGLLYIQGDLVGRDEQKGVNYLERAAKMQYAPAMLDLGKLYFYGQAGLKLDKEKGFNLIQKAAYKNNAEAMLEMSLISLKGLGGQVDLVASRNWLIKAYKMKDTEFYGFSTLANTVRKVLFPDDF